MQDKIKMPMVLDAFLIDIKSNTDRITEPD